MMLRVIGKLHQACRTGKEEESDVQPAVGQELCTAAAFAPRVSDELRHGLLWQAAALPRGVVPIRLRRPCEPAMFQRHRTRIQFSGHLFERHFDFAMQQEQLRVLLIEDDEGFARAVSGMLEQTRETAATVVVAPSLDAGLSQLAGSSFDVVILEFFLPDGAGLPNI